jgi:hypothetical protein
MAGTANAATPAPLACLSEPLDCLLSEHGREYRRSTNRRPVEPRVFALSPPVFAVLSLPVRRLVQDRAAS